MHLCQLRSQEVVVWTARPIFACLFFLDFFGPKKDPSLLKYTWEAHMTRPFFQPKSSPFPGPWNHAEVKATSQIAPRVVQKAPLLIRSGKYLICVCEGVVLRQCDLIIRMSVVWRWEPFDARWTCILWRRASFCIGFFAYDTCMFMVIRLPCTYLCIFSAVLVRLCIFYCVASRCVYSAECDGCACRECHVHCSTRWCESCQWQSKDFFL